MSANLINYEKNKMIFSELIGKKYKVIKNSNDKHILTIISADKEIKCKYILLLFERKYKKKSQIIWSDYNPFIDQYTRKVSEIIRNCMRNNLKYISNSNNQFIDHKNLKNLIQNMISHQYNFLDSYGQCINCNWILLNDKNININDNNQIITEYYMITDIIYY